MAAWAIAYSANRNIKSIKMVQNGIRQEGIMALLRDGLAKCEKLEVLDLQDNTFTAKGSRSLADAVSKWPQLKELGVGDCLLSARGGVMVAEALQKGENQSLEVLRLQYNEIAADGLKAFAEAARGKALPALRRIELNGNKFSEDESEIEELKTLLDERRESATGANKDDDEEWGVDELDDMEEEDSDEEEEAEDEEDAEEEKIIKDADAAEAQPVAQRQDEDVDDLADSLKKTEI